MLGPALDATRQRDHFSSSSNSETSSRLATSNRIPVSDSRWDESESLYNEVLGPPSPEAGTCGTLEGLYGLPCAYIYLFVFH